MNKVLQKGSRPRVGVSDTLYADGQVVATGSAALGDVGLSDVAYIGKSDAGSF